MTVPATVELAQHKTVRLITTGRLKDPVLLPLAANQGALDDLAELEGFTNDRLRAQEGGLEGLDPRELAFGKPNYTFINAAFTHTRPGGNRFNDEDRGAWYCAFDVDTALGEVGFHLTRELQAIGRFENTSDYAELFADFIGSFHDIRGSAHASTPYLNPDPDIGYPAGQALARELRLAHSANGIIYSSIRHSGGTCLVAFRPDLVQNVQQGGILRLEWQGASTPSIKRMG